MKPQSILFKGFRFGMLLQLAVGPVCLFVLQSASARGFWAAESAAAAATLVDAAFISLAILGVASVVEKTNVKRWLMLFGAAVLILFGAATVLGAFGISILPGLNLSGGGMHPFFGSLLLTLSNPLTILFWAGVFAGKVAELDLGKRSVWLFGAGALASTAVSLTVVALLGGLVGALLPAVAIQALNGLVGAALIFFGVRMALPKRTTQTVSESLDS